MKHTLLTMAALAVLSVGAGHVEASTFTVTIDDQTHGPYPAGTEAAILDTAVTGQIVRIDADQTTGGNTGATEIEIYATT